MKVLDFLCIGDIHLEAHSRYSLIPDFIDPIKKVMRQVINYAKNNGISTIFQLGDVFNTPYPLKTTQIEWLKMLDSSLDWHIICGNHDYVYDEQHTSEELGDANAYTILKFYEEMKALPHIHIYTKPVRKTIKGIDFNFLPYPYTKPLKKNLDKVVGNPSIKFGHFEVSGYKMDNGCTIKGDTKCDKYTILGHIHTPQPPIYPGSILQANFGEVPEKQFWHCTAVFSKGHLKIERKIIPIKLPFKLITLKINEEKDLRLLDKYKNTSIDTYIIKLIVNKDITLPSDLKIKYTNIENIVGCSNKVQADALERGMLLDSNASPHLINEKKLLKNFLSKQGLSKKDIKKCIKIVEDIKPFQ